MKKLPYYSELKLKLKYSSDVNPMTEEVFNTATDYYEEIKVKKASPLELNLLYFTRDIIADAEKQEDEKIKDYQHYLPSETVKNILDDRPEEETQELKNKITIDDIYYLYDEIIHKNIAFFLALNFVMKMIILKYMSG